MAPEEPGRAAYVVLLACTTLGTLSSTLITSPINQIADGLEAGPREIVFAVAAFTLAMVVAAPLAGWLCERLGPRRFLVASLGLMVAAGIGAALSPDLLTLVGMRALQGLACSAIPPAVQQTLGFFWVHNRARVMATWASAIGVGQALGPPIGGLVADLVGWRGVFVTHAALAGLLAVLLLRVVPAAPAGRPPMHVTGMLTLVVGAGGLVGALTVVGQGGALVTTLALAAVGLVGVLVHLMIARRSSRALVEPRLLREPRYFRSTVAAGSVMSILGMFIVATPLELGRAFGLSPGRIGAITVALAASMAIFAPVSSRIGERITPRRVMHAGLAVLVCTPLLVPPALALEGSTAPLVAAFAVLALSGCAIGAVQSVAALGAMRSPASRNGTAMGIHNMVRFSGLAAGYAWVALSYPTGHLMLVFAGPATLAALTLAVVLVGPPAAPVVDTAPTLGTGPGSPAVGT
ncbi:MFS transporter [Nocardioides campestrisoli]|uniref:MFS transporter n=1 Tax=Nocardioides campestrisoli TaxID=2736757 RepID=UPI00163DADE3|nr:MFS transporter [Nocardioides campestrisoli]